MNIFSLTAMRARSRRASSLLEVSIALVIFVVVISAILQVLVAARSHEALGAAQDDLTTDSNRIFATMAKDLSASGWFFPQRANLVDPTNWGVDRTLRYFPYVIQQATTGGNVEGLNPIAFPHLTRVPARVALTLPTDGALDGTPADRDRNFHATSGTVPIAISDNRASFFARSQELVFVKLITDAGWQADPNAIQQPIFNFSGSVADWQDIDRHVSATAPNRPLYPSGWIPIYDLGRNITGYMPRPENDTNSDGRPDNPYGVLLRSGRIDATSDDDRIERLWETIDRPPSYDSTLGPITDTNQREYFYAVVPSPVGVGRLVRAYKARLIPALVFGVEPGNKLSDDGNLYAMVVQTILSENVARLVCDTCRTDLSLDVNEVRVRLYLARREKGVNGVLVHRMVESVFSLRAKAGDADRDADAVQLNVQAAALSSPVNELFNF